MKKKLGFAALALFAASSLVACKPNARPSTNKPQPSRPQEENVVVQQGVQKFTGETTIKDVKYTCELHTYADKKFNLYVIDQNKVYSGTYEFFDGIGYQFIFADGVKESVWNPETKSHELTYKIRLGRKGSGNVTVSLKDEAFVPVVITAKDTLLENAHFKFDKVIQGHRLILDMTFDKFGNYKVTSNIQELARCDGGTYKFENNTFTLTEMANGQPTGKVYTSVYDPVTSTYTFPKVFCHLPSADMPVPLSFCTRTLGNLHGEQMVMDRFNARVDVKFLDDKNAFFDCNIHDGNGPMDARFDKKATYEVQGNDYIFHIEGQDTPIKTTYDRLTGEHKLKYVINGDFVLEYELKGKLVGFELYGHGGEGMLESDFQVDFLGVNEAKEQELVIRCITKFGSMNGSYQADGSYKPSMFDKKGILVKAEDGSLSIKVGETVYPLTFDAEKGTYSFDYIIRGQQGDINATISATIWD